MDAEKNGFLEKGLVYSVVIALLLTIAFVGSSAFRQPTNLETILFTVIIAAAQIFVGYFLGEIVATRRLGKDPFKASALRRVFTLADGLSAVRLQVLGFMEAPPQSALSTPHDDLWPERLRSIESYISQLIAEVEASRQDWLEQAPEELDTLYETWRSKREEMEEVFNSRRQVELTRERVQAVVQEHPSGRKLTTLEASRTKDLMMLNARIEELSGKLSRIQNEPLVARLPSNANVSKLLAEGRYPEAVRVYTERLRQSPRMHTLYIGRARAKHCLGDYLGAIEDLNVADALNPTDPASIKLRSQIGETAPPNEKFNVNMLIAVYNSIARGAAEEARRLLKVAHEQGLRDVHFNLNSAIIELLDGNVEKAEEWLSLFGTEMGDFMRIQVEGLLCISAWRAGKTLDTLRLETALALCPEYDYQRSPLRSLESGLATQRLLDDDADYVFGMLRGVHSTPRPS